MAHSETGTNISFTAQLGDKVSKLLLELSRAADAGNAALFNVDMDLIRKLAKLEVFQKICWPTKRHWSGRKSRERMGSTFILCASEGKSQIKKKKEMHGALRLQLGLLVQSISRQTWWKGRLHKILLKTFFKGRLGSPHTQNKANRRGQSCKSK